MPARPRVLLAAGTLAVALVATAATALTSPAATAESGTVEGPGDLSVTTAPADLSTVKAGDRVRLTFRGLDETQYVDFVGNCPSPFPGVVDELSGGTQLANACLAEFDTGLQGAIDATTGANLAVSRPVRALYPDKDGEIRLDYLVGTGTSLGTLAYQLVYKTSRPEVRVTSMTCGPSKPCSIGFAVRSTRIGLPVVEWLDLQSLVVRPAPIDVDGSGCGAADTVTLSGVGPERGQPLLSALNRGACSGSPQALPVDYVPSGENDVTTLGGETDLALAGSTLLSSADAAVPDGERVLVPLGLSAAVLGEVGGPPRQDSRYPGQKAYSSDPLPALSLTAADAARVLLHDYPTVDTPVALRPGSNTLARDLKSRPGNAATLSAFDPSQFGLPLNYAPTVTYPTGQDATPAALSAYLDTWSKAAWTYPDLEPNREADRARQPVGRVTSFDELVDPGLTTDKRGLPRLTAAAGSVGSLYAALFGKDIASPGSGVTYDCPAFPQPGQAVPLSLSQGCLRFLVADAATIDGLRLPGAEVQNSSGSFIAPTREALQAATVGAKTDESGVLVLPAASEDAYPMTFVEYAVVPKAPLLTADCLPRAAQQDRLASFLTYAVGAGQEQLPAGMAPLTDDLKELARTAIASIGTGAVTGACAKTAVTTPLAGGGGGAGSLPGFGSGSVPGAGTGAGSFPTGSTGLPSGTLPGALPGSIGGGTVDVPAGDAAGAGPAAQAVPRFAGVPVSSGTALPLAGLAVLVAAVSAAGLGAGGRVPAVAPVAGRVWQRVRRRWA